MSKIEMVQHLHPEVQAEFDRWVAQIGDPDPYDSPETIGIQTVLKAHFLLADYFLSSGRDFALAGPRDINLLHSALGRQFAEFGGVKKWTNKYEVCATLFFGLIKDHPFHDANKRTAFLTMLFHFRKLRLAPTLTQKELEDFAVDVAESNLNRFARYREEFAPNYGGDADVLFIADYFRRGTRQVTKSHHSVTFRELDTILRRFGYELDNPHRNTIDIVTYQERRTLFRGVILEKKKMLNIGFPGWSREVERSAVSKIRKELGLTAERGYDSETFFRNAAPIDCLIRSYQVPLLRLAER